MNYETEMAIFSRLSRIYEEFLFKQVLLVELEEELNFDCWQRNIPLMFTIGVRHLDDLTCVGGKEIRKKVIGWLGRRCIDSSQSEIGGRIQVMKCLVVYFFSLSVYDYDIELVDVEVVDGQFD